MFNPLVFSRTPQIEEMMKKIGVSKEGIELMSKKGKFLVIHLYEISLKAALILKQESLAVGMECALPWCTASLKCDSPIEALLFGTKRQFEILIEKMKKQPFKGKMIASEIENSIKNYERNKFQIKMRKYRMDIPPVRIMGVLNVTPDSFSDGGKYLNPGEAIKRAKRMIEEGADIIDIGGESSRPFSEPVSEEEEMKRIMPVIDELVNLKIPISVDTYKPRVAEEALKRGVSMINDIFALRREGMAEVIRDYDTAVVIMHMKGEPKNMQKNPHYDDTIGEISKFLRERIEFARNKGIEEDKIIIDPGIGFGKRVEDNLRIIKNLDAFKSMGYPILIGTSRKSFIGNILNLDVNERLEGTITTNIISVLNGASIIRVHDVKEHARSLKMLRAIMEVGE